MNLRLNHIPEELSYESLQKAVNDLNKGKKDYIEIKQVPADDPDECTHTNVEVTEVGN
jgi:hypothetical protein